MLKELQDNLIRLTAKSEEIRLRHQGKPTEMNATEEQEWSNIIDEMRRVKGMIEREEQALAIEKWAKEPTNQLPLHKGGPTPKDEEAAQAAGNAAFRKMLLNGGGRLHDEELKALSYVTSTKAYQADNPAGGGFLIVPMSFASGILTLMKDLVFIRQYATLHTITQSESLGVQAIDTDPSDADWTTEIASVSEESSLAFGRRELKPNPVRKLIKLSNKLVRTAPNVEGLVQDRMGYKFQITEEKAFLTGTGANQPLGLFTASPLGISTSRDITAAGSTSLVADDFLNTTYGLKAQYRARSRWILHRDVVKATRKLKDSNNNYLWATGLGPGGGLQGTPETLCNRPVMESEYASSTLTSGLYVGVLGDFSFYHIADALDMQIQVLHELYAGNRQTGYILEKETDGMPVLEEAFARLKMA